MSRLLVAQRRGADSTRARIAPFNAAAALTLPSPYSPAEMVHPDVVYVPGGFNGFTYIMGVTPYPSSDASKENPSVLVSNDRTTWTVPPGATNPVQATFSGGNNSDPDLIFDGTTLHLMFRQYGTGEVIYHRSTTDLVTWTARQTLFSTSNPNNTGALSPAFVHDGSTWWCYTVTGTNPTFDLEYRTASTLTGTWSSASAVGYTKPTYGVSGVHNPWHVDAFRHNGLTYLLINEEGQTGKNLRFAVSSDGINFTPAASPFMQTPSGTWDGTALYRSTCAMRDGGDLLWVWYSATGPAGWAVGYAEVPANLLPTP